MSPPESSIERRPLAAREFAIFKRMATALASRGVSPNAISIASIVCGVTAGAALAATNVDSLVDWQRLFWIVAAALIQLRLLMNMLDGMVALVLGRSSVLGELYNEIPDRISDAAILIGFGYAHASNAALGYVAACLAIFVAYVRAMGRLAGAPQQYCGPMAKPHRMLVVTLAALSCGLLPSDLQFSLGSNHFWTLPTIALSIIIFGAVVTAIRRLHRIGLFVRGTVA